MDNEVSAGWADPSAIPDAVRENVRLFREDHGRHEHPVEVVRSATYHGHRIVVRTRYSVEVDGRPLGGHLAVTDDGSVHYHTLPDYSFGSALDLGKQVIDSFPDDFNAPADDDTPPPHHHEHRG